jgi:hypothetical protein
MQLFLLNYSQRLRVENPIEPLEVRANQLLHAQDLRNWHIVTENATA